VNKIWTISVNRFGCILKQFACWKSSCEKLCTFTLSSSLYTHSAQKKFLCWASFKLSPSFSLLLRGLNTLKLNVFFFYFELVHGLWKVDLLLHPNQFLLPFILYESNMQIPGRWSKWVSKVFFVCQREINLPLLLFFLVDVFFKALFVKESLQEKVKRKGEVQVTTTWREKWVPERTTGPNKTQNKSFRFTDFLLTDLSRSLRLAPV